MAANRIEEKGDAKKNGEATPAVATPAVASSGGIKSWLPLILNLLLMPALAFAMTQFVLLPKLRGPAATNATAEHGKESKTEGAHESKDKPKFTAPLSAKILVNVSGTMGTRYLLTTITLVSGNPQLKELVEKNDAQLRDVAATALSTKSISDLEKPGARNVLRAELITVFNNVLGNTAVSEIYLTEFAIQ